MWENFGFQIIMSTEKNEMGIFLDIAKSLSTVDYEILIRKLDYYGIKGVALDWMKSYLIHCIQCTEVGDTQSELDSTRECLRSPHFSFVYQCHIIVKYQNFTIFFKFTLLADDTSIATQSL